MFGRRKNSPEKKPIFPATVASDGKRRVFGEAVFAGPHGEMLRKLGFGPDDEANVIKNELDIKGMMEASLARQEMRRQRIEADLLARTGHNAIRPFLILTEQVYSGTLGTWLTSIVKLMPYDDWNIVYLPMDVGTRAAMDNLPLHPRQSIRAIDELMVKHIKVFFTEFLDAKRQIDARIAEVGWTAALPVVDSLVTRIDQLPRRIIDHVDNVRPIIIELIADVQRRRH